MKLVKHVCRKGQAEKQLKKFGCHFQVTSIVVFLGKIPQSPMIKAAYSLEKIFVPIFMGIGELTLLFIA